MRYCSNCRAQLRDNENFCQNCGSQANNQNSIFNEENTVVSPRGAADFDAPTDELQKWQIPLLIIGVLVIEVVFFSVAFAVASNSNTTGATSTYTGNANRTASSFSATYNAHSRNATNMSSTSVSTSTEVGREGYLIENLNVRSAPNRTAEVWGTHYQNAKIRVLNVESYSTAEGHSTWYKVKVLNYGCDSQNTSSCGKNWERNGNFGWMEGSDEGWMNAKYISLE